MWDTVLVVVVVGVCAVLIGRNLYRQFAGKGSCGCACSGGCPGRNDSGRRPDDAPGCGCPPSDKVK